MAGAGASGGVELDYWKHLWDVLCRLAVDISDYSSDIFNVIFYFWDNIVRREPREEI
jgi:hypothetical protein